MSQEIANKTKKQTFIKCKKCGDEIFGIPTRSLRTVNVRRYGWMDARIIFGSVVIGIKETTK